MPPKRRTLLTLRNRNPGPEHKEAVVDVKTETPPMPPPDGPLKGKTLPGDRDLQGCAGGPAGENLHQRTSIESRGHHASLVLAHNLLGENGDRWQIIRRPDVLDAHPVIAEPLSIERNRFVGMLQKLAELLVLIVADRLLRPPLASLEIVKIPVKMPVIAQAAQPHPVAGEQKVLHRRGKSVVDAFS